MSLFASLKAMARSIRRKIPIGHAYPKQQYVSRELTHFVGKLLDDERRYRTLFEILKTGWLTPPPHDRTSNITLTIDRKTRLSENEMYFAQVVCFCDIPVKNLRLHMDKYSRFGLAFLKSFLVPKGANPVFYMAKNSAIIRPDYGATRATFFDSTLNTCWFPLQGHLLFQQEPRLPLWGGRGLECAERLGWLFDFYMFAFVKFFDDALPDEDPNNFYMEREWRKLGGLNFELRDVYRVILPRRYGRRFRTDMPGYSGRVTCV